jgi:hypothetical protein
VSSQSSAGSLVASVGTPVMGLRGSINSTKEQEAKIELLHIGESIPLFGQFLTVPLCRLHCGPATWSAQILKAAEAQHQGEPPIEHPEPSKQTHSSTTLVVFSSCGRCCAGSESHATN